MHVSVFEYVCTYVCMLYRDICLHAAHVRSSFSVILWFERLPPQAAAKLRRGCVPRRQGEDAWTLVCCARSHQPMAIHCIHCCSLGFRAQCFHRVLRKLSRQADEFLLHCTKSGALRASCLRKAGQKMQKRRLLLCALGL